VSESNNQRRKRQRPRRRPSGGGGAKPKTVNLWQPVPRLDDPVRVSPAGDATALLRSLGDPPLSGQGAVAEHYLAAVVERAAGLATALAAAADLLAEPEDEQQP
jgi:hypothetical protein